MELYQNRYLVAVCETLSFARAAERCRVSSPSLTRAVRKLEQELGGLLIRRERRLMHLTELGLRPMLEEVSPLRRRRGCRRPRIPSGRSDMAEALPAEACAAEPPDLRARLRLCIETRHLAERKVADCEAAVSRGAALLREIEAELEDLRQEQRAAVEQAGAAIMAGIINGREQEELPSDPPPLLRPPGLTERRQVAEDRLAAARHAASRLQATHAEAQASLGRAASEAQAVVVQLLVAAGTKLAEETAAAEKLALQKRQLLEGLGRVWLSTDGRPALLRLSKDAARLLNDLPLNDPNRPRPGLAADPVGSLTLSWRQTASALLHDAEAPLPE
jgi:hypothetical protein